MLLLLSCPPNTEKGEEEKQGVANAASPGAEK